MHVAAPRAAAAKGKAAARYVTTEQSEDEDDSDGNQMEEAPEEVAEEDAALFCMDLGHEAATQKQFSEKCAARRPAARSALSLLRFGSKREGRGPALSDLTRLKSESNFGLSLRPERQQF